MLGIISYLNSITERHAINRRPASDPARLRLSDTKLERLCPSLYCSSLRGKLRCLFYNGWGMRYFLRDMLIHGDSRAAVVVSIDPLLVACYSDDLDGVCLLRFDRQFVSTYGLRVGSRLLTVLNADSAVWPISALRRAWDLAQSARANPCVFNFWPLVAEFLSDDMAAITVRKLNIADEEFLRCRELGESHLAKFGGNARNGRPDASMRPMPRRPRRRRP